MRTGELLVKAARAVRAIAIPSLPIFLARIQHGQTNQKLTIRARGYNKKNALACLHGFYEKSSGQTQRLCRQEAARAARPFPQALCA
jgi:hypothetical protein